MHVSYHIYVFKYQKVYTRVQYCTHVYSTVHTCTVLYLLSR